MDFQKEKYLIPHDIYIEYKTQYELLRNDASNTQIIPQNVNGGSRGFNIEITFDQYLKTEINKFMKNDKAEEYEIFVPQDNKVSNRNEIEITINTNMSKKTPQNRQKVHNKINFSQMSNKVVTRKSLRVRTPQMIIQTQNSSKMSPANKNISQVGSKRSLMQESNNMISEFDDILSQVDEDQSSLPKRQSINLSAINQKNNFENQQVERTFSKTPKAVNRNQFNEMKQKSSANFVLSNISSSEKIPVGKI